MGASPFESHDTTHLRRLSLVGTDHLHALVNTSVHYSHFMLTALGYQPRTTSASSLLIRLIVSRATYRNVTVLTDLGGCPWPYTRLACIRPLTGSTAVQLAWLTLSGDSCQAAFHRVAPAYGPKRPYFKLVNANETDEFQLCPTSFASKIPHSRPSSIELPDLLT